MFGDMKICSLPLCGRVEFKISVAPYIQKFIVPGRMKEMEEGGQIGSERERGKEKGREEGESSSGNSNPATLRNGKGKNYTSHTHFLKMESLVLGPQREDGEDPEKRWWRWRQQCSSHPLKAHI